MIVLVKSTVRPCPSVRRPSSSTCLQVPATARASFYLYNTTDDVDRLVESLLEARSVFGLGS